MLNASPNPQKSAAQPHREAMMEAARGAGEIVLRYRKAIIEGRHEEVGVKAKSPHPADIVTHADCQAQDAIQKALLGAFPAYGFYAEENGCNIDLPPAQGSTHRFVVDPIDGTFNFSRGIADFSISIALQEAKGGAWHITAGLLSMPAHGEIFFAEGGKASHIAEGKETAMVLPPPTPSLSLPLEEEGSGLRGIRVEDAIYCLKNDPFQNAVLRYRDAMVEQGALNVKSYSTAQRLGEIAAQRIPGLIVGGDFHLWDVAAGLAVAGQAGAAILHRTDLGEAVTIVAATEALARAIERVWAGALGGSD